MSNPRRQLCHACGVYFKLDENHECDPELVTAYAKFAPVEVRVEP